MKRVAFRMYSTSVRSFPSSKCALVVGNDEYAIADKLPSCAKDALDVHNTLKSIGFDSVLLTNASGDSVKDAIFDLGKRRTPNDICLFYFSGHGLEYSGRNYLLNITEPVEKGGRSDQILLQAIISALCLKAKNGKTVVISDACRVKEGRAPALSNVLIPKYF
eukprot:Phypoly_transcript_22789.p1 GENE.Phypoly_transcript_22789~~Phypoly_transcript_22789.p1  ORF type:complete len:191 (+),score=8.90 Phypoly_transcript_22789:87-575(+)